MNAPEVEALAKDMFAIHARLFNHGAVVRAECQYLVKELELKRSDRELAHLKDIVLDVEKAGLALTDCDNLARENINAAHTVVLDVASCAYDVLHNAGKGDTAKDDCAKARLADWDNFEREISAARADVLRKHEERMEKLKEEYANKTSL